MKITEKDREARRDRIGCALRIYAMAHGWSHLSPEPSAEWDDMQEHRKERWRVIADVVLADVDDAYRRGLEDAANKAEDYCRHATRLCAKHFEEVCPACLAAAAIRKLGEDA